MLSTGLRAGLGWRHPHHAELLARRPPLAFLEVHSENFFADGGAAPALLDAARVDYPLSLHGVGLGLGSAEGLDPWHLEQLARLVERVQPLRVSDHACFARAGGLHAQDLLPLRFDEASLALLVRQVEQVQQRLRRPILIEHLSAYVQWEGSSMSEPEFFNELTRRSGCGLLLDLNNLVVNSTNQAGQGVAMAPRDWIAALRPGIVGEIHIAGHAMVDGLAIDDHGSAVGEPVWELLAWTRQQLGPLPVLLERDTDIPSLDDLLIEVAWAEAVCA